MRSSRSSAVTQPPLDAGVSAPDPGGWDGDSGCHQQPSSGTLGVGKVSIRQVDREGDGERKRRASRTALGFRPGALGAGVG